MSQAYVNTIINNALSTANAQTAASDKAAREASTASMGFATLDPPPVVFSLTATEPVALIEENSVLTFEAQRDKVIALLSDQLAGFFLKYYPLANDAFDEATAWLVNTITNGGTGINKSVEDQIWQRGRDRVVVDGKRAESQVLNDFASRGFSLPSGVLAARLQEIRFEQLGKTQELSRDVAIEQAKIEIESLRFAVEQAIDSRMKAMSAAADYIRSLMSGYDAAAQVAALNPGAKARMMTATADLYRARLSRDELALKIPVINQDINMRSQIVNYEGFYKGIDARVAAAGHAAEAHGKVGQAALSSLSAIAGSTASSFT